jgi:DNA-directed RNA polymerase specialized sigma24 family protein
MSPASLRRYRAERLLREEFRSLRASVIASVRARLRACGAELADDDLDACYAQAWQGLYAVALEGEEVLDAAAWLSLATYRRAVDEHRAARRRQQLAAQLLGARTQALAAPRAECADDADAAGELDRRLKLGQLFEALRLRLSARERRAFVLCHLQGLSRSEAAAAMGLSERRMRKLMDGRGGGESGAAAKVSALVNTIRAGRWCEEQGSLMRGLAYGVLDPQGERHRLALVHTRECPACRSYVASLRGLAALLPPVPAMLALLAAARDAARDAVAHAAVRAHVSARAGVRGSVAGAAPQAAVSGTAGAGAAGGGWLLVGGGAGAKLAATCLLALGLGAGCAVLAVPAGSPHGPSRGRVRASAAGTRAAGPMVDVGQRQAGQAAAALATSAAPGGAAQPEPAVTPAARASREFGPEHANVAGPSGGPGATSAQASPRASAAREFTSGERPSAPAPAAPSPATAETTPAESASARAATTGEGGPARAQREFSPG